MSNFEKITASLEALGEFLASLTIADGPWEEAFHRAFCDECQAENCDAENCPHNAERDNPLWWLNQTAEGQGRVVMWVKRDGYRKAMEEFAGKIREARSERVKATGDKSFTHLEALLTELVEVLLPDEKCRVVMDYDPDTENVILSQLPARDIQAEAYTARKPMRFQNGRLQKG